MKSAIFYTSLEQSRKLAEILPLESADMCYIKDKLNIGFLQEEYKEFGDTILQDYYPCWSLNALLDVMRIYTTPTAFSVKVSTPSLIKTENGYKLTYTGDYTPMIKNELNVEVPIKSMGDNAIDACVTMIEKLHELKML